MPQLGNAQTGLLKSTPKITRINGDDNLKVIYRNMGNNHAYPFVWGVTTLVGLGTDVTLASGIKFHGFELASYANIQLTITSGTPDAGTVMYIEKDKVNNIITIKSTGSGSVEVDVKFMLGMDPVIADINCTANYTYMPALP